MLSSEIPSNKDFKFIEWCVAGASIFSTCEKQQYMAIIVDINGVVESTGYNGAPSGFDHCNTGCPRWVNQVPGGTPYDSGPGLCYAIHSEINCLIHSDATRRRGGTMYVNGVPCFGCAKALANSGLGRLVYLGESFDRIGHSDIMELLDKTNLEVISIGEINERS